MWPFKKKQAVEVHVGPMHCIAQSIIKDIKEGNPNEWIYEGDSYKNKSVYVKYSAPDKRYTLFVNLSDEERKYVTLLNVDMLEFDEKDKRAVWDALFELEQKRENIKKAKLIAEDEDVLKKAFPRCFDEA